MKKFVHRLRRARGQMEHIEQSVVEGVPCDVLLPQLLAIKGAVDNAVAAYIQESLAQCKSGNDVKRLEKVITTLLKIK